MKLVFQAGFKRLARCFMAGLFAVLPLVLTIAIISWVAGFVRSFLGPNTFVGEIIENIGLRLGTGWEGTAAYLLGFAIVIFGLFALGVLVESGFKRILQRIVDAVVRRIPIVGGLYGSLKQLVEVFSNSENAEIQAMSVVFCQFSKQGGTGVLALMPSPMKIRIGDEDHFVVMIPTAPIPFGGGMVFIPADQVRFIDMSVDHFVSIYVSMGVTVPEFMRDVKTLERPSQATELKDISQATEFKDI